MGKVIAYAAAVIMIVGVIIHNFVYEFSGIVYPLFLFGCVLLGVVGYLIDRKEIKKQQTASSSDSNEETIK